MSNKDEQQILQRITFYINKGLETNMKEYRIENDSMGELKVPSSSYYGAQTMRAIQNFPISDLKFQDSFIKALAQIKLSAAEANFKLNLLEERHKHAIVSACEDIIEGKMNDSKAAKRKVYSMFSCTKERTLSQKLIACGLFKY